MQPRLDCGIHRRASFFRCNVKIQLNFILSQMTEWTKNEQVGSPQYDPTTRAPLNAITCSSMWRVPMTALAASKRTLGWWQAIESDRVVGGVPGCRWYSH